MPQPPPEELLRRLRAIYCRHRGITYETYDRLVAEERITFAELIELCEVLFTEIQHVGLYDFLFREEVRERKELQKRLAEIETALGRIGTMSRKSPALAARYRQTVEKLREEGNAIKRRLAEST